MIDREDMLELTRRMTPARASVDRLAGAYFDEEGYIDGTFNTHFLKLSVKERTKNLALAKAVLFAETNSRLRDYRLPADKKRPGGLWQLLDGIKACGLKNDVLLETLYETLAKACPKGRPLALYVFHGCYDVPVKGTDKEWLEGSEETYEYLICALAPYGGDYEVGEPEFGFLYPAFRGRTADDGYVNVFEGRAGYGRLRERLLSD